MNTNIKPIQSQAHLERQARIDLAACHRIAARFELHEAIDNHMTLLVPGCTDRFYLAPFGMHWSEIRASDFCEVDLSGRLVAGKGSIEPTALYIHAPVHRLAPRARCVLHTHMPYTTALTMLEEPGLRMVVQSGVMFHEEIAFVDYNGLAYDQSEGERLAQALGNKSVLLMRNHGVLVIGGTVPHAFEQLYYLERAAQAQILAMSTGKPLHDIPGDVVRATVTQFSEGAEVGGVDRAELHFAALKRMLDRSEPDYAT
jgi:ribulose-5-phosphate 4-epimerase/fuculose-1-phosphate aldolase